MINLIMSGMCLQMKGLRMVMNCSLNSTRLARFCTALATSFSVRMDDSEGLAEVEGERERDMIALPATEKKRHDRLSL